MNAVVVDRQRPLVLSSGAVEALKWLALAAMVVDHVNAVFFARELGTWATVVGRVAMPLFAIVLGYNLARPGADHGRIFWRLLDFGLLSFIPYAVLFAQVGGWFPLNILFTFAVAVGCVALVQSRIDLVASGLFAVGVFIIGGALVEYWWPGVALVLAAYWMARAPSWRAAAGVGSALCFLCVVNLNGWALLAIPVLLAVALWSPNVPRCGRFFWWFYPLHLVALALAVVLMK